MDIMSAKSDVNGLKEKVCFFVVAIFSLKATTIQELFQETIDPQDIGLAYSFYHLYNLSQIEIITIFCRFSENIN